MNVKQITAFRAFAFCMLWTVTERFGPGCCTFLICCYFMNLSDLQNHHTHTQIHTYFWSISILPHMHKTLRSFYSFLFSTCLYFSIAFFISLIVGRHYTNKLAFICKVKVLSVKLLNFSSPNWRRTNPTIHPWNEAPVISLMSGPRLGNLANSRSS